MIRLFISARTPAFPALAVFFHARFSHSSYPPFINTALLSIASLEMLDVIVSLKLWSEELRGQRILVRTVSFVQSCLRKLWFYASHFYFELRALYIPGHQNTLADSLSCWDNDPQYQHIFYEAAHLTTPSRNIFACLICFVLTASGNHLFVFVFQVAIYAIYSIMSIKFKTSPYQQPPSETITPSGTPPLNDATSTSFNSSPLPDLLLPRSSP